MRAGLTTLALLSLTLAGCGPARHPAPGADDSSFVLATIDPEDVTTKIVGASPEQEQILREILAGMGRTGFTEVYVQKPEPAWGPSKDDSIALVVPHEQNDLLAEWLSWLLANAFAQRSREQGLPPVSYVSARRGGVDAEGLGTIPLERARVTSSEARRAAEEARRAAAVSGGAVDRIEILKPYGYAFFVQLRVTDDPARFLQDGLPKVLGSIGGPQPIDSPYAGDYTVVVDSDGDRIWEAAEAYLGDASIQVGGATRWELEGCSPLFRSGPPGRGPPPCPVKTSAQPRDTTKIVGATPKQETILQEILAGLGQTMLEQVRVSPADADWTPSEPNSVVLHIDYSVEDEHGRASWEADLLAQAFDRRSRELHLQPVVAYETPDGGTRLEGPDKPERPLREAVTAAELTSKAEAGAQASGAELVDLRVVRPQHLAVAITLSTDHPAEYLKDHLLTFLDAMPSPSDHEYDGRYVLVVDRKGKFVWLSAQTTSDNISGGSGGTRRDLEGCDPVPRSRPVDYSPPPCPAG